MAPVDGRLLSGDPRLLTREVSGLVIAGMTMPNVLDRLFDGAAVITAADRPEVVVGVLMAHASQNFPQISAIFLNGGFALPGADPATDRGRRESRCPIIETALGTQADVHGADRRPRPADEGLAAQDGHGARAVRPSTSTVRRCWTGSQSPAAAR